MPWPPLRPGQTSVLLPGISQGCGRSEGKRGLRFYCENFDDYVADVLQLARCADHFFLVLWATRCNTPA